MEKPDTILVKKKTILTIILVAFGSGFFSGFVYNDVKSHHKDIPQYSKSQPSRQTPQISQQQADQILALEQEVVINPENAKIWTQLGHLYFDTDNYEKAIRAYNNSLELSPDDPNILTDLGVMYRKSGRPQKAIELFIKAAELDPLHEQSRFNKGVVLIHDFNDKEGAIAAWKNLLEINPSATSTDGKPISEIIESIKRK